MKAKKQLSTMQEYKLYKNQYRKDKARYKKQLKKLDLLMKEISKLIPTLFHKYSSPSSYLKKPAKLISYKAFRAIKEHKKLTLNGIDRTPIQEEAIRKSKKFNVPLIKEILNLHGIFQ